MRPVLKVSDTRRPPHEVQQHVAKESDFWGFLGTVLIPIAGVALLGLAVGAGPRLALDYASAPAIQQTAGRSPQFDTRHDQRQVVSKEWYRHQPTNAEPLATDEPALEPPPVEPPFTAPPEPRPLVTVERRQPPARIEPLSLPPDHAGSLPPRLEPIEPAAGPIGLPRDMAAVPRSAPPTPEPPTPEPPTLESSAKADLTELPGSPEETPQTPVETYPGPAQPVLPQPKPPPVEVVRELPTQEPSVTARLTEPPAPPEQTPESPVETQPGPAQIVPPQPPVEVVREPPPAEAVQEVPAAALQAQPAPRTGSPAAETPQVAMVRPGPAALLEQLLPPGRGSGQKLLARLAATESTEGCDSRELPFFRVIESNVYPARSAPGGRFSHRLVYALCPAGPGSQLTATVTRELRGSAEVVLVDQSDDVRLRPGTWASDEELVLPPNAVPGRYTITSTVTFGGSVWTEQTDLLIE